jgi:hypothetical protein
MIPKKCGFANRSQYHGAIPFFILLTFCLFTVLLIFPYSEGHSAQVTLTWDPNSESDLAGYKIYYGTASGNYQWKTDVGNVTIYTQSGLDIGGTYYFAATAYNTQGLESGFSNEVVYTAPSCTYTISPSSASFPASGGSGNVLVTTQAGCNWGTSAAASWVTVNSGSGTGNGTMSYTISSNTGTTRVSSLTVAGNVFTITEAGLPSFTITASAGTGGTISPSGGVSVRSGANQTFTITPNSGYSVSGMTVDGASVGVVTTYTFTNVTANHTIAATFSAISASPIVSTGSATLVTSSSAKLNGTVNPNGLSTSYIFQWGRTTSYGNTTAVTSAGNGTVNIAASAGITGLRSSTVYYYRLRAINSAGTTYGANLSFKTNSTGMGR